MNRMAVVQESRGWDSVLDPVYTSSSNPRPIYRTTVSASTLAGQERFKFQRAPVVPILGAVPPDILLSIEAPPPPAAPRPPTPPTKEMGTQSDYRESEAQTDPYTPEYVITDGSNPELLTLANLSYGAGLPATLYEVELIERARARRQFDASLPDIREDPDTWRDMMEAQQMREMKDREQQIIRLQAARLDLMRDALRKQEDETEFDNLRRVSKVREEHTAVFQAQLESIRRLRIKFIRKLGRARSRVSLNIVKKRDIIADYSNPGSQVYASQTRLGRRVDKDARKYETPYLENLTLQGLLQLESRIPQSMLEAKVMRPNLAKSKSASDNRKLAAILGHLDNVEASLAKSGKGGGKGAGDDLSAYRKAPVVIRAKTPDVHAEDKDVNAVCESDAFLATVFLQKMLRGRATQLRMFTGKERRFQLIKEMRTVEVMPSEQELQQAQAQHAVLQHEKLLSRGALAHAVGAEVGRMLDYLSKELVRYKEERRLAAMVMLAERQRRMREASEGGRRHDEIMKREQQDEVKYYRIVVKFL